MTETSYQPGPKPRAVAVGPRWQAVIVGLSLGIFLFFVALPLGGTLLFTWTLLLLGASAHQLDSVGALEPAAFSAAVYLSATLLAATTLIWARHALVGNARAPREALPAPTTSANAAWTTRRPWLISGAVCALVDLVLIPIDRAHVIDIPDGLAGAGILSAAVLGELAMVLALFLVLRTLLRGVWRLTRRSPFAAGAVTVAGLSASLASFLFASALGAIATAIAAVTPLPEPVRCAAPALTCANEFFVSASHPRPAGSIPALPPPETQDTFSACVEELRRDDLARGNAYSDALILARQRVRDFAEAEDVVQDTLLEVCQRAERLVDVRAYFIRSVSNNAGKVTRRSRRFCTIEPEVPDWEIDQCVARSVEQQSVSAEMQAAAHDALCSLDRKDRDLIQLRVWKNRSHREIADRFGWTEATARQSYHRAVEALRAEFQLRCR